MYPSKHNSIFINTLLTKVWGYMFRLLLSHHQALKIQIRVTKFIYCTVGSPMLTKYILRCILCCYETFLFVVCRNGLYGQWRVGEFGTAIFLWRGELGGRLVEVVGCYLSYQYVVGEVLSLGLRVSVVAVRPV